MAKSKSTLEFSTLLILLLIGCSFEVSGKGKLVDNSYNLLRLNLIASFIVPNFFPLDCDLLYLKEPRPSIVSHCNPYGAPGRLKLECQVQVPASVGSTVEILWFFRNTSNVTLLLGDVPSISIVLTANQTIKNEDVWNISSNVTISELMSPMHEGNFYCQVAVDGNIKSLSPSNDLCIGEIEDYLNEHPCTCTIVASQDTMKCAGNVDDVLSSSTLVPEGETTEAPTQLATSLPSDSSTSLPSGSSTSLPSDSSTSLPSDSSTSLFLSTMLTTGSPTLSLWIYILVAVAAVFGMIILVLVILSVGLCLKKNNGMGSFMGE